MIQRDFRDDRITFFFLILNINYNDENHITYITLYYLEDMSPTIANSRRILIAYQKII